MGCGNSKSTETKDNIKKRENNIENKYIEKNINFLNEEEDNEVDNKEENIKKKKNFS